jgi:hypothetical protein
MHPLFQCKLHIGRLRSRWPQIVACKGPARETVYRIEKLASKLDAVAEKTFLKTLKARAILLECAELTERLQAELEQCPNAFLTLTRLEGLIDDLVKKTHDFRIKAG